jgi:hypothetical protein
MLLANCTHGQSVLYEYKKSGEEHYLHIKIDEIGNVSNLETFPII